MTRQHGPSCRCAKCRHARFHPGPPSKPRGFYGHFKVGRARKAWAASRKVELAHAEAIRENESRGLLGRLLAKVGL